MIAHAVLRTCIYVRHESDVVIVRQRTRELGRQQGLSAPAVEALATAATEIAQNMVEHAGSGEVSLGVVATDGRRGVVIHASDTGPGIADLAKAMEDGYTTGNGLGLGLPGARRLVDDFELESTVGQGTTITLCKWLAVGDK